MNNIANADETLLMFNGDNGTTVGFRGDDVINYTDVNSESDGIIVVVYISGGVLGYMEKAFLLLKNKDSNRPIWGINDNFRSVCFQTDPKGGIYWPVMPLCVQEWRAIAPFSNERKIVNFLDNCAGRDMTPELKLAQNEVETDLRFFPPNATYLVYPADSLIIQKSNAA